MLPIPAVHTVVFLQELITMFVDMGTNNLFSFRHFKIFSSHLRNLNKKWVTLLKIVEAMKCVQNMYICSLITR